MINVLFRFTTCIIFLLTASAVLCQQDRRFKGRLVLLDGNQKLLKDISVRLVDQGSGVTGTDGEFAIAISNKAASVTLNLVNSNWGKVYFSPNTFNSTASTGLTPVFPAAQNPGAYPVYTFQNPGKPYSVDFFNSRAQVQLGLRYSF